MTPHRYTPPPTSVAVPLFWTRREQAAAFLSCKCSTMVLCQNSSCLLPYRSFLLLVVLAFYHHHASYLAGMQRKQLVCAPLLPPHHAARRLPRCAPHVARSSSPPYSGSAWTACSGRTYTLPHYHRTHTPSPHIPGRQTASDLRLFCADRRPHLDTTKDVTAVTSRRC